MHRTVVATMLGCLFSFGVIASCGGGGFSFDSRLDAVEGQLAVALAQIAALEAQADATQAQADGTQAQLDGLLAPDGQVAFAKTAGDADTLDGFHANEIAESGTFQPILFGFPGIITSSGPFAFLRTGNRVRVTGSFTMDLIGLPFLDAWIDGLPYRATLFSNSTDVVGVCSAQLDDFGFPVATVSCTVGADGSAARVDVEGASFFFTAVVSVDFSYDVDAP